MIFGLINCFSLNYGCVFCFVCNLCDVLLRPKFTFKVEIVEQIDDFNKDIFDACHVFVPSLFVQICCLFRQSRTFSVSRAFDLFAFVGPKKNKSG